MLDRLSLDHLRFFLAVAEEGSFTAAGRRLGRAQSVVSEAVAALEGEIGVSLFVRKGRYPVLTPAGRALIAEALAAMQAVDAFRARAGGLARGLEAELSIVVDVMYPMPRLTDAVTAFREQFPSVALRLYVEALGGVLKPVLTGACQIGIAGSLPTIPRECDSVRLLPVRMIPVAAPCHPLAQMPQPVSGAEVARHVQIVLTDRTELTQGREFGVMSPQTWRLADLGAKHEFLRAGLGWGNMPLPLIAADLAAGALVHLNIEDMPFEGIGLTLCAIYRRKTPPGPAGRWMIERLKEDAV